MAAWLEVAITWREKLLSCWLFRTVSESKLDDDDEGILEQRCAQLLQLTLEGAPFGISLSQPWTDFARDLRRPDHPTQRVPSNLTRFAGNYINLILCSALLHSATAWPILFSICVAAEIVALFAPPEMFDVHIMQFKSAGGGFRSIGGTWLRCLLAAFAQVGSLCSCFFCHHGQRGLLLGTLLVLVHAFFRARPWTVMAKEGLKSKLS
ncbi:unnamed protein product [Durusdinium trenchii]|uniref:PRA1 family protein n=2 Tax=Durusdinium trenchii TaxID=1381693 RepID=A0ABP0RBW3_9DINO